MGGFSAWLASVTLPEVPVPDSSALTLTLHEGVKHEDVKHGCTRSSASSPVTARVERGDASAMCYDCRNDQARAVPLG